MTPLLRRLAELLHDGSIILYRRRVQPKLNWVRAGESWWETPLRAAMLALPAWIVIRTVRAHTKLMWPLAIIWCWAAIRASRAGPRKPPGPPTPAAAAVPESAADDDRTHVSPEQFLRLLCAAIGPHRAVHLVTLVEQLVEQHPGRPWDTQAVRVLCAAAGVPVRGAVRAATGRVSVGVHRDDLPPVPGATSAVGQERAGDVVVAGQDATTPPTTTPATTPTTASQPTPEGDFVVEDDPATRGARSSAGRFDGCRCRLTGWWREPDRPAGRRRTCPRTSTRRRSRSASTRTQ